VLYAAGDRGYDFIVIAAGEIDVLRPAMPNAPEALIAIWGPGPWSRIAFGSGAGAPTSTHGAVVAGEHVGGDYPLVLGAHCVVPAAGGPAAGGPAAAGTRSSR
jgi:hypothetical protein